jgi:hypothetical protein
MFRRYTADARSKIKVRAAYPLRELNQISDNARGLRGKRKELADKQVTSFHCWALAFSSAN